jgi:hypothetical protein
MGRKKRRERRLFCFQDATPLKEIELKGIPEF